jgi:hypothetical protein
MRKYVPVQGRWLFARPCRARGYKSRNPQSWNRYAYVNNNPLLLIDALGLCGSEDKESERGGDGCNTGPGDGFTETYVDGMDFTSITVTSGSNNNSPGSDQPKGGLPDGGLDLAANGGAGTGGGCHSGATPCRP